MSKEFTRRQVLEAGAIASLALSTRSAGALGSHNFEEYRRQDAAALAELVRRGDASPLELLELAISRAEAVEPKINAISVQHFDLARAAAKGKLPDGPLRGVPFLLKDLAVGMRGTVTTEGSRFFQDRVHDQDSTIVERYKGAGLVIFGKTHSPEFGSTPSSESVLHGTTHNPWDPSRSPGGSSGGAAAAVAAGILPVAHATDGGGSIRIPASSCGLIGLKPSRGRNPMGPAIYEAWNGLSAGHVVSRSVRDSALFLDATQGSAIGDAYAAPPRERPFAEEVQREPGRLRIALMTESPIPAPVAPECVKAAENAAKLCASLGHEVEVAGPQLDTMAIWEAFGATTSVGTAKKVGMREAELGREAGPGDLEQVNLVNVANGRKVSGIDHARARDQLHTASRVLGAFHQKYDVILSPTMAQVPPKLGALSLQQPYEDFVQSATLSSVFCALFNITGQPAISLPMHWTESNLPVGVMFASAYGDEATLFRLAAQLETAQPWFDRVPAI